MDNTEKGTLEIVFGFVQKLIVINYTVKMSGKRKDNRTWEYFYSVKTFIRDCLR